MTRKITFPQLVAALCDITSSDTDTASNFIKEVFDTISSALARGEKVTVKGLGTFVANGENGVSWIPDETLAGAVNEPFAFFEAVELEDGVTEETLAAIPPIPAAQEVDAGEEKKDDCDADGSRHEEEEEEAVAFPADMPPIPGVAPLSEPEIPRQETPCDTDSDTEQIQPAEPMSEHEDVETPSAAPHQQAPQPSEPEDDTETSYYDDDSEEQPRRKCRIHPCMTFVAGLIIGLAAGYFGAIYAGDHFIDSEEADGVEESSSILPEEEIATADSLISEDQNDTVSEPIEESRTEETPYLAIDTVSPNRYLTTMSRQYYGDYRFWVYIYEENKDAITNPDHINPGTTVIIPRKEKYGIDVNDKESLAKAERKSREIQAEKRK